MNKRIFLSYCWSDSEDVNSIDSNFSRFGIHLTRDLRDLKYNTNIHQFMDGIKKHDKIIIYVSNSYLQSVNCMYEASQIFDIKDRVVFILKKGTDIFSVEGKERFILYWKSKYEELSKKDFVSFKNEIEDTNRAYQSISKFIDLVKNDYRMNNETLDFESLFACLEVEKLYPEIITEDVLNWIAKYSRSNLATVISLIHDLYQSTRIISSEYANIPDDEKSYFFKKISFYPSQNGIELSISVQNVETGAIENIVFSHLVEIEENTIRSAQHSKFYFYYEVPSKKQKWFELDKRKKFTTLTQEEKRLHESGYCDVSRITIRFD